ncbi:MAG: DUF885 domain-containing protein, partial [Sphingomonadales bacterium]
QMTRPAATPSASASAELAALFKASEEASLKRNPMRALARGDMRYADRLGDGYSDASYAEARASAESDLAALARIDRAALTPTERVSYDVFKWDREGDLRGLSEPLLGTSKLLPLNHFYGLHTGFSELSSGESVAPYKTLADYENGLTRVDDFVRNTDQVIARLREGAAKGVVQPRLVMENVLGQLDALLTGPVEQSSFYLPITKFPDTIAEPDRVRLRAAYTDTIANRIRPALTRLRDYVRNDYLPRTRTTVGLGDIPGGAELYRFRVAESTTTDLTPEQIHQIGLDEVTRLHAEMEKVKTQVGFTGTLQQFFEHIRTDPKFKPKSREELTQGYYAIGKRLDATLPRLFSTIPKTPLEIRPTPALTEKGAARGSYQSGNPDGSRPGVFYFNAYDLPSRTTPSMETLYLHEGAPGHHFQIMLAQENAALPDFQRFGGNTAYVEGWGLYAETLGKELGVYTDPYQYFGYLDSQLFRAIRLVVDTGIHAKGWSRDKTIQYI